jgi:hypothetical protein
VPFSFEYGDIRHPIRRRKIFDLGKTPEIAKKHGILNSFAMPSLNVMSFYRMIAKIAHSYAIAELGLNKFTPLLRELILGDETNTFHLVGSKIGSENTPPSSEPYEIGIEERRVYGITYAVANVRIFATVDKSPIYQAVVGVIDK